jgi:hypothetical protein
MRLADGVEALELPMRSFRGQNIIHPVAEMFEIRDREKRAILVTFCEGLESSELAQSDSEVIQLSSEVIQLNGQDCIESRILELQLEISELKLLLLSNQGDSIHKKKRSVFV